MEIRSSSLFGALAKRHITQDTIACCRTQMRKRGYLRVDFSICKTSLPQASANGAILSH